MGLQEYLDDAGLEPEQVEEIPGGDIVNTYLLNIEGELSVFQYAGADEHDKHSNLVRGSNTSYYLENTGIPVPERLDFEFNDDRAWHHLEHVEGSAPSDMEDWRNVGRSLATIHDETDFSGYGFVSGNSCFDDFRISGVVYDWGRFLDRRFSRAIDIVSGSEFETESVPEAKKYWEDDKDVLGRPDSALLHGDISDGNVLTCEGRVTGWIDFDQASVGDPDLEFFEAVEGLKSRGIDPEPFKEGYQEVRAPEYKPRHDLYGVMSVLKQYTAMKYLTEFEGKEYSAEQIEDLEERLSSYL